jgi:large subunit ribosomal protein L5
VFVKNATKLFKDSGSTMTAETKTPRLLERFRDLVVPELCKEFKYENALSAPRLEKIVVNMGVKEGAQDIKLLEHLTKELAMITGQQPIVRRAKKAIANFKLKKGSPIGLKVTLRRRRMYEFFDRLVNVAMPRIRDFRGFSPNSFDEHGNLSVGIQEQNIFPEVELDRVMRMQGMDITFVTTAKGKEEGRRFLELMGFPFRK